LLATRLARLLPCLRRLLSRLWLLRPLLCAASGARTTLCLAVRLARWI
jgi:hypothetical protein